MNTDLLEALSYISVAVYCGVAVAAYRLHRRVRTERSVWLFATFATLAFVVVLGLLPPATEQSSPAMQLLGDVTIAVLLLFPYCLFRFAAGFRKAPPLVEVVTHLMLAGLVVTAFVLPMFPEDRADFTPGMQGYVFAILAYWTLLSGWVAWELFRGGLGQPGVARRRMRLLSAGTLVMNVALLLAGAGPTGGTTLSVVTTILGWLAAVLFLLGFAPPGGLRHAWRQGDERELRRAEASLMSATTSEEVANTIVPRVAELMGGHGAVLLDKDGAVLAAQGFSHAELDEIRASSTSESPYRFVLPLESGRLVLQASVYAPFFGEEELELLRSLGTFVDLALGRIALFEQELLTRTELERTNDELTALVYGISHDLRSPIVTVIGYLELLSTDAGDQLGPEARHYLDRISFSARYMDSLIRDLLELSRIGRTQTDASPVALGPLVEDIATELRRTHQAARFAIGELPTVTMNPVRARQLFTNLMENAVRHGGRDDITVSVSADQTSAGQAVITLADDGTGIAEPYRERVFGIFERLEEDSGTNPSGTGIGLTMCRKIVEQLSGSIWIDPSEVGTTFKLALPTTAVPQQSGSNVEVQRQ